MKKKQQKEETEKEGEKYMKWEKVGAEKKRREQEKKEED